MNVVSFLFGGQYPLMGLQATIYKFRGSHNRGYEAKIFHSGFLFSFFFEPEDGGDIFLRNIG
jgi:hypothetical protein